MTTTPAVNQHGTKIESVTAGVAGAWADMARFWAGSDQIRQMAAGPWSPLAAVVGAARAAEQGLQAYQRTLDVSRTAAAAVWATAQRQQELVLATVQSAGAASSAAAGQRTVEMIRALADATSAAQHRMASATAAMMAGQPTAAASGQR